jgi:divalent metal cation (Fe/Co/Zn/Cd) transporter
MQYHVDLHAIVDSNNTVKEGHDLAHKLKDTLREQIQNWDMYWFM